MFCKKCGSEISENETFCPKCSEPVTKIQNEDNLINKIDIQENNQKDIQEDIQKNNQEDNQENAQFLNLAKNSYVSNEKPEDFNDLPDYTQQYKNIRTKNTIKKVLVGCIAFIILGGALMVFMNIYNNSPERIFDELTQSEAFENYITKKDCSVIGYYFIDLLNNDSKSEIVIDVVDKSQSIEKRMSYIAFKENGVYKIGEFGRIGGEFIDSIEVFKSIDTSKSFLVHIKNIDEASQDVIDAVKSQTAIEKDEDAKDLIEQMYAGLEQYVFFDMSDYDFISYGEKNAENNNCDFTINFSPEKFLAKKTSKGGKTEYQYVDIYSESSEDQYEQTPDYSISEDEFNNYINEFKNNKQKVDYFEVSDDNTNANFDVNDNGDGNNQKESSAENQN